MQHTFSGGFAVVGGVGEILGLITVGILGIVLLARRNIASGVRAVAAALCLLGTLLSYFFNRPINARIADWTPATLPPDWTAYRDTWEVAHAVSAALAAAAFVLIAVSAVWGALRSQDPMPDP